MAGKPSFQFYPGDWVRDPISGCSLAAQGLWLRMMFLMHDAERYGYLTVNGSPVPPESIARRCGCTLEQYETLLDELERAGVPSRTSGGIIYSRRLVRDAVDRARATERKKKSRVGARDDPGMFGERPNDVTQKSQRSSSSSSFSKTVTGNGSAKNGTGPPPIKVWKPGTALERISDSERILLSRILDVCGDHENRAMYVGLIRKHSEGRVEMAMSETKQAAALGKIKKTKGAYFVDVLKRLTPKTAGAA